MDPAAIAVNNLCVTFSTGKGVVRAVKDVSFEVRPGEGFGLVGESGSGKSTVLRVLAGLIDVWEGHISIEGISRRGTPHASGANRIQLVFQDPYSALHPRHTVDRALREPLIVARRANVDEIIDRGLREVGLGSEYRYRYPNQLSGGQRQRVAIARGIILEPAILLLDEPTSALDVSVQAEILNLLRRIRRNRHMTFILVSHNLGVVANMCDRFAVMRQGEIVETAEIEELRRRTLRHGYSRELLAATIDFDRGRIGS